MKTSIAQDKASVLQGSLALMALKIPGGQQNFGTVERFFAAKAEDLQ